MAKAQQTNSMPTMQGRYPGLNAFDQISNLAWTPKFYTKTADYTCKSSESGAFFVTTGATAAVNFTLPAITDGPFIFFFINGADQTLTVTAGTADTFVLYNDLTADSIALSTSSEKIGGGLLVVCDGTTLFGLTLPGDPRYQTYSIVTA